MIVYAKYYDDTRLHELLDKDNNSIALAELADDDRRRLNEELYQEGKSERWFLYDSQIYY